jgi:phage shock protein A
MRAMTKGPRIDEAFARFELMERRVDLAEGRAEAYDLAPRTKSLDEQISELRTNDSVAAELAALKAKMGKGA